MTTLRSVKKAQEDKDTPNMDLLKKIQADLYNIKKAPAAEHFTIVQTLKEKLQAEKGVTEKREQDLLAQIFKDIADVLPILAKKVAEKPQASSADVMRSFMRHKSQSLGDLGDSKNINIDSVLEILKQCPQEKLLQYRDSQENNGLHLAVLKKDHDAIQHFLTVAPELLSTPNHTGETPLLLAIIKGDVSTVALLIAQQGPDLAKSIDPNVLRCFDLVNRALNLDLSHPQYQQKITPIGITPTSVLPSSTSSSSSSSSSSSHSSSSSSNLTVPASQPSSEGATSLRPYRR